MAGASAPNRGFGRHVTAGLDDLLTAVPARTDGGPVSLVGWSLGGIHAIGLAAPAQRRVRGR